MRITKGMPLIAVCCLCVWGAAPAGASDVTGTIAASARHPAHLFPGKRKVPPRIKGGDLFQPRYWGTPGSLTGEAFHVPPTAAARAQTQTQHTEIMGLPLPAQVVDQTPGRAMSAGAMQTPRQFPGQSLKTIPGQMTGQQAIAQVPEQVPFTFVGRMIDGNKITLFVTQNDHQFLARVNDVIGGAYRVDNISGTSAVLTYLPTNTQQTLMFNSTAIGSSALGDAKVGGATGGSRVAASVPAGSASTQLPPSADKLTIK